MEWISQAAPSRPGPPVRGTMLQGGRWSQLPLVQLLLRGVGYLPSLPPNTSRNQVCPLGP